MGRARLVVSFVLVLAGCVERELAMTAGTTGAEGSSGGPLGASETSANATTPTTTEATPDGPAGCPGLGEDACLANPCDIIYGWPIDVEAGCFDAAVFLACVGDRLVCTGVPTVVCAGGAAMLMKGGCVPPGFVACDVPAPESQCS